MTVEAFRFVHTHELDPALLAPDFLSDSARGKPARGRAVRVPELRDGLSVFKTLAQARDRRRRIAARVAKLPGNQGVRIGDHIARLVAGPGQGFAIEDRNEPDGHMTIWGDPSRLARCVVDINPVED